jgi:hypothetical protein
MSFARPYVIAEEDGEAANSSDNELELIDYGKYFLHHMQLPC